MIAMAAGPMIRDSRDLEYRECHQFAERLVCESQRPLRRKCIALRKPPVQLSVLFEHSANRPFELSTSLNLLFDTRLKELCGGHPTLLRRLFDSRCGFVGNVNFECL